VGVTNSSESLHGVLVTIRSRVTSQIVRSFSVLPLGLPDPRGSLMQKAYLTTQSSVVAPDDDFVIYIGGLRGLRALRVKLSFFHQ
jgi:hypothetical protein